MAGETKDRRRLARPGDVAYDMPIEFNKLVDDIEAIRAVLGSVGGFLTSAPTVAIGTSAATAVKTSAFTVQVRGADEITVAAAETAFTATTHDIADPDADPRESYYVLCVDAAGSLTIVKGTTAAEDLAAKPAATADTVAVGYIKVQHDGSAIFNASTDDLDAAHLTTTFEDAQHLAASVLTAGKFSERGTVITT